MRVRIYNVLAAGCCLLFAACSTVTSRLHPTVEDQLLHIERVAVLPPIVEVYSLPLQGRQQRRFQDEVAAHLELIQFIDLHLNELGYTPITTTALWLEDSAAPFTDAHTELRAGLREAINSLEPGKPLSPEEARSTIARADVAHISILAEHVDADALLFVRHIQVHKTGGHIAADIGKSLLVGIATMGFIIPISGTSASVTEAALIHMETGAILWADRTRAGMTARSAESVLKSMPTDTDPLQATADVTVEAREN